MHATFLTVADPHIGLGHLYRCDALATALNDRDIETTLVVDCRSGRDWLNSRAPETRWIVAHWMEGATTTDAVISNASQVIVDAYGITQNVRLAIDDSVEFPIYFDDYGTNVPKSGIVINGSPGAQLVGYPKRPGLKLLLGTDYQLLRKPFWDPTNRTIRTDIESVGVLLGGTDPRGITEKVLEIVRDATPKNARVYAIGVDSYTVSHTDIHGTGRLTARGMKNLFDQLDLLVTAAGQTVAEAVSCRLPTVMIQTANNQRYNVLGWTKEHTATFAGTDAEIKSSSRLSDTVISLRSFSRRKKLLDQMKKHFVTQGAWRVADWIIDQNADK